MPATTSDKPNGNPKCFALVCGCCSTGICTNKKEACGGCADGCVCPPNSKCKVSYRTKPDLGGGTSKTTITLGLIVISAACAAAFYMKKKSS